MTVKLLIEHHLEFLGLKGGCTGSSESTLVKMPHCWKSHVVANMCLIIRAMQYVEPYQAGLNPDVSCIESCVNPDEKHTKYTQCSKS